MMYLCVMLSGESELKMPGWETINPVAQQLEIRLLLSAWLDRSKQIWALGLVKCNHSQQTVQATDCVAGASMSSGKLFALGVSLLWLAATTKMVQATASLRAEWYHRGLRNQQRLPLEQESFSSKQDTIKYPVAKSVNPTIPQSSLACLSAPPPSLESGRAPNASGRN
jgi:hypothetical protein